MEIILGLILLTAIFLMIKSYIKRKKKYMIVGSVILIIYFVYSFFSYDGAVRLGIVFTTGDVFSAYTTKIEESSSRGNENKYFYPTKNIKVTSGTMNDMECINYVVLKMCKYYGY